MKTNKELLEIFNFFNSNDLLNVSTNLTYKEFFLKAKERSKHYDNELQSCISLSVENTEEALIDIVAIWISNKSVILHPPKTPTNIIENSFKEIISMSDFSPEQIACYIFTSGSTNRAKAIPLTFTNLLTAAKNYNNHFTIKSSSYLPITLPIYHVGGLLIFLRAISSGAKTSIHRPGNITAKEFKEVPSHISVVPLQLERILDSKNDLEFFKDTVFVIGGAKTSIRTLERIEENNIKASSTYGMTETTAMIMATEVSSKVDILKSVGRPLEGITVSLDNNQTITITSPTVTPIMKNRTIQTKDKAYIKSGMYFIEGRVDDVFISAGENINPLEIESVFRGSGVEDPYIIPVDDIKYGKKSFLFFRGEKSISDVKEIAKSQLPPFKRPKHYFKIPDFAFTGIKIKKSILKELAPLYSNLSLASEVFPTELIGDPRKPWIVFLHGFMGDKSDWTIVANRLKKDFFCISVDTPGHGENTKLDYSSLLDYQNEFKKFTSLLNHKFHLLGYSQGGRIAQGLVLSGVGVESLILESTSPGIVDEEERERRYKTDLKMFKRTNSRAELREFLIYWYNNPLFGELKNHPAFENLLEKKSSSNWKLWQESMTVFSVGNQPDYREGLSRLKGIKALIICGENDHKYVAASQEFKTKFNFDLTKISNCSHNTHFENPIEFTDAVTKFLKS